MSDDIQKTIRLVKFNRNDLRKYADKIGTGRGAIEKDFLISTFLLLLAYHKQFTRFAEKAVLTGGTCIRKAYYPNEARLSEDLDFASLTVEEMNLFLGALEGLRGQDLGVTTITQAMRIYENSKGLDIRLNYTSVLGQPNHIMFNLRTGKTLRTPRKRKIEVLPYFTSFKPEILVMDRREILAEKLRALLQRVRPRDVFDVWFLTSKKGMRIHHAMLKEKLMKSYEAAPEEKKELTTFYSHTAIIDRMEGITETGWKQELGGLLTKASPSREAILSEVSKTLKRLGNIRLEPRK